VGVRVGPFEIKEKLSESPDWNVRFMVPAPKPEQGSVVLNTTATFPKGWSTPVPLPE